MMNTQPVKDRIPFISAMVERIVANGRLSIVDWKGRRHEFGDGSVSPTAIIRINDRRFPLKVLSSPSLALGEAYMDGTLTIEQGDIRALLKIMTSNLDALDETRVGQLRLKVASLLRPLRRNPKARARKNVSHHYDLSGELYRLFLDEDWQYSCAYFPTGAESLEQAQAAKKRHLAAKLLLRPGDKVLDIGSGWGGLALDLARREQVSVHGVTLSTEQLTAARRRSKEEGLEDRVRFDLTDYRDIDEQFDKVVSVGMFEHVGTPHYAEFFNTVSRVLKPGGVAVLHSIGRRSPPGGADPWISKYIFPGGYIPALSEVLPAIERSGLWVTDIEILRLHYADTLRHWYDRFQKNRDKAKALYDERFCRMWEFYLAACEMLFRQGELMVFQIQLAHERDDVPLTRDYITDYDRNSGRPPRTDAEKAPPRPVRQAVNAKHACEPAK